MSLWQYPMQPRKPLAPASGMSTENGGGAQPSGWNQQGVPPMFAGLHPLLGGLLMRLFNRQAPAGMNANMGTPPQAGMGNSGGKGSYLGGLFPGRRW